MRRVRGGTLALLALVILLPMSAPAAAHEDHSGNGAICNVRYTANRPRSSTGQTVWAACVVSTSPSNINPPGGNWSVKNISVALYACAADETPCQGPNQRTLQFLSTNDGSEVAWTCPSSSTPGARISCGTYNESDGYARGVNGFNAVVPDEWYWPATITGACGVTYSDTNVSDTCTIATIDQGASAPDYPPHNWAGSGSYPYPAPQATCTVEVGSGAGATYQARIRTTITNPATGATDVVTWEWGDGSTESVGLDVSHRYASPDDTGDPWHATGSVVRDGNTTTQLDLETDIDFAGNGNPSCTAGTNDPTPGPDVEGQPEECGFFDVVCWLRKLFIPDESLGERWEDTWDDVAGHYPLGPAVYLGNMVESVFGGVMAGYEGTCTGCGRDLILGPSVVSGCPDVDGNADSGQRVVANLPLIPGEDPVAFTAIDGCEYSPLAGARRAVRIITTVLLAVGAFRLAQRLVRDFSGGD